MRKPKKKNRRPNPIKLGAKGIAKELERFGKAVVLGNALLSLIETSTQPTKKQVFLKPEQILNKGKMKVIKGGKGQRTTQEGKKNGKEPKEDQ